MRHPGRLSNKQYWSTSRRRDPFTDIDAWMLVFMVRVKGTAIDANVEYTTRKCAHVCITIQDGDVKEDYLMEGNLEGNVPPGPPVLDMSISCTSALFPHIVHHMNELKRICPYAHIQAFLTF